MPHKSHYPWNLVGLLWAVALLNYLDRQVIFSIFPLLKSDLGLSNVQLGLLSTVFLWSYGGLSVLAGHLGDRFDRARLIQFSLWVWCLVTFATGRASGFGGLLTARALMGISEAFYLPTALALIADYHGERTRSLATGLHMTGLYVGMVFAGVGGGWMGEHWGWRGTFTVLGLAGVTYAAVLHFTLKPAAAMHAVSRQALGFFPSIRKLISLPGYPHMVMVFSIVGITNWMVYTWLPTYIYERFRLSLTWAGFSATFYIQVAAVAGIVLGGWLSDHWGRFTPRGRLFVQAIGLGLAAPALFLVGCAGSLVFLVLALAAFGIGRGFYDSNTMPVLCQIADPDLRATGFGIFNFASCLISGVTASLAGHLKSTVGLAPVFKVTAILLAVSVLVLLKIRLPKGNICEQ
jgi:MFS family permease